MVLFGSVRAGAVASIVANDLRPSYVDVVVTHIGRTPAVALASIIGHERRRWDAFPAAEEQ